MNRYQKYPVHAWWRYNPIIQKPASLDPVRPNSYFYFYGPDPTAGCSYGQYHDKNSDGHVVTEKMSVVYSPMDGSKMDYVCDVDKTEVEGLLQKSLASSEPKFLHCDSCNYDSRYVGQFEKCFCTKCGKEINNKGDKAMANVGQIRAAKARIQARVKKVKADDMMNEEVEQAEQEISVDELIQMMDECVDEEGKVSVEEIKEKIEEVLEEEALEVDESEVEELPDEDGMETELPEDEDEISVDEIVDIVNNEEKAESETEDMYIPLDDVINKAKAGDGTEFEEEVDESEVEELPEDESDILEVDESEVEELPEDESAELPAEGIPSSEENPVPETKENEFLDLNMVLSKKRMLARKAKAAECVEPKKEEKVKAEKPAFLKPKAEEICEDKKPADKSAACENEPAKPIKEVEETMEEKVKGVKFEPVAMFEALSKVAKNDIDMILYNEQSENPVWNITVAGIPAARIQLSNQESPVEIKKVFCSEAYARELIEHCDRIGFIGAMKIVRAEFWATADTDEKRRVRYKAEASASLEKDRKEYLARFKNDFMNCLNISVAGVNKNYYPEVGNPLKDHLFTNMKMCGLPESSSISVIEKSFKEASAQYFQSVFAKATEYMNVSAETRAEIAKAISGSNTIERDGELALESEPASLAERAARSGVTASINSIRVEDTVKINTNEYKNQLRSVFRR